ncbi:MAG TPA: peptidase, partial [Thermoanaerobaculia bacterium]
MKKMLLSLLALLPLACNQPMENKSAPEAPANAAATTTDVMPDVPQRAAQLPKTPIDYDRALLKDNEREVVAKLIEASKFIDDIYWLQVAEDGLTTRDAWAARAPKSPLEAAGYEYLLVNRGRWDRLKEDEPFLAPFNPKPPGAAFYPADLTKEEMEKYIAAHPDQKDALQGLFTVVRREGGNLTTIPYSKYYAKQLEPAAAKLREAANLTDNVSLKTYLTKLADAFGKDNYRDSDMAWMDLDGPIEVVIGPYEVYEDALFNYKAAFESFITVVDRGETDKLSVYAQHLPGMEQNLPIPDEYKNPNRGTESPLRVVQELYTAGDARRGVQTAAFNLPNDEYVREKKGSKKVLLKNVMDAKYRLSGEPIANRVLTPEQRN